MKRPVRGLIRDLSERLELLEAAKLPFMSVREPEASSRA